MPRKSKRSLERDSEGISPPGKMAKSREAFETQVLARLDSIDARFGAIDVRFANLEAEVAKISQALADIEALRDEVKAETASMRANCESFQRMELEAKKRSVLVRGLKFGSSEKYETRAQTKAALAEFFDRLEIHPHLVDYQRLGYLKPGEDGSKISIRVQFADVDQRLDLFDKLKVKGHELSHVSILTDYPQFQIQEFKALSNAGYKIRTEAPGTKTRIVPRGLGLILQKKVNDKWTAVSG